MNRVPASLAVVMLAASGHPVSPITLRSWVYRGHISRQEGGYDLREILDYIEQREARRMPFISLPTAEDIECAARALEALAARIRGGAQRVGKVDVNSTKSYPATSMGRLHEQVLEYPAEETWTVEIEWVNLRNTSA